MLGGKVLRTVGGRSSWGGRMLVVREGWRLEAVVLVVLRMGLREVSRVVGGVLRAG